VYNYEKIGEALKKRLLQIDKGIIYMLFASLLFAFMGAFAKILSSDLPSIEIVFFRNVFGVLLISMTIWRIPLVSQGGKPWLLFFRGFMGFTALLAFFYNIAHISLADAMTFSKTSPIFTALFAYFFLHESLGRRGWIALFIGFIGIVMITGGGLSFTKYDWLGIFSGVGAALAYTSVKELKKYYDTRAIVMSFMLVGTIGPIILMLISTQMENPSLDIFFAKFVMPSGWMWAEVMAMGSFATLAQVYMTKAYGETKAGIVGAISYSNIPFSIIVGLFLGDNIPTTVTLIGITFIISSGLLVANIKR
jgi:drug/metabolite transporter (DMT)-like permease